MARSVDQVQYVFLSLIDVFHLDGVALDRDSLFPFELHVVQYLCLQFPFRERFCRFEQTVG